MSGAIKLVPNTKQLHEAGGKKTGAFLLFSLVDVDTQVLAFDAALVCIEHWNRFCANSYLVRRHQDDSSNEVEEIIEKLFLKQFLNRLLFRSLI